MTFSEKKKNNPAPQPKTKSKTNNKTPNKQKNPHYPKAPQTPTLFLLQSILNANPPAVNPIYIWK